MGAKDISLLSLYAPNDTVIFMNTTTKETDTMFVVDKDIYNSLWPFIRSEASAEYYAGGYIEYVIKHKDASIRGTYIIQKQNRANLSNSHLYLVIDFVSTNILSLKKITQSSKKWEEK